jgi:SAM-dependent methyltransferase
MRTMVSRDGGTAGGGLRWALDLKSASAKLLSAAVYQVFDGKAEDLPPCFFEGFDVICSINAFEHIHNIWKTLDKLYFSLKPGGVLVAVSSPIWPGRIGHHVWINKDFNFGKFAFPITSIFDIASSDAASSSEQHTAERWQTSLCRKNFLIQ